MQKLSSLLFLFLFFCFHVSAQELNCDVRVSYENIQQTDPTVFRGLEDKIRTFMNETVWTSEEFQNNERIDCSVYLNIKKELDLNKYSATATIKSTRPVFNSSYTTVVLDIIDNDFDFEYDQYTVFQYRENDFANNLTASLAFYAYTIIGLDFDTFSVNSGMEYHKKAQEIVQTASSSPYSGWTQSKTNNNGQISRYWINQNLTNSKFSQFKSAYYEYHREGLDQLFDEPSQAWERIANVIYRVERIDNKDRNLALTYMFFKAKAQEIVDILKKAPVRIRSGVSEKAMKVDPLNSRIYKQLTE